MHLVPHLGTGVSMYALSQENFAQLEPRRGGKVIPDDGHRVAPEPRGAHEPLTIGDGHQSPHANDHEHERGQSHARRHC
eukprot:6645135-Prymnesium_polylepis.1